MESSSRARGFQRSCDSEADQRRRITFYEDGLKLWHSYRSFYDKVLDTSETAIQSDKHLGKFWTLLVTFTEAADLPVTLTRDGLLNA
jgi:hypothetical protein